MAKTKNKKKIGIAAVALAMILAASATAGVTLARYVSEGSVETNTATVAKWGFTLTANADSLFGETYEKGGTVAKDGDDTIVVSATAKNNGTTENVVAPGTQGEFTLTLNGKAEVNSILTINVTEIEELWICYGETYPGLYKDYIVTYFPITWKVNDEPIAWEAIDGSVGERPKLEESADFLSFANSGKNQLARGQLARAIYKAIEEEYSELVEAELPDSEGSEIIVKIPAQTELEDFEVTIGWDWAIHTEGLPNKPNICDEYDSVFGVEWFHEDTPFDQEYIRDGTDMGISLWLGNKKMKLGLTATLEQTLDTFKD